MKHPVQDILAMWPARSAIHTDAKTADPDLNMVAVHRWFQRNSVPAKYWAALISGACKRGLGLSADDFVRAHAPQCHIPSDTASYTEADSVEGFSPAQKLGDDPAPRQDRVASKTRQRGAA